VSRAPTQGSTQIRARLLRGGTGTLLDWVPPGTIKLLMQELGLSGGCNTFAAQAAHGDIEFD